MAPRKQTKQAAAESIQAAADGNVTPPKKRKTAAKSTVTAVPKQAKAAVPRQVRQVKERETATAFSPKKLRSRQKDVPKNDTENKSKMFVNKWKEEKTAIEDNDTDEQIVGKKTRGGGKSAVAKKAGTKTTTSKPKVKALVIKKQKEVGDGAGDIENDTGSEKNPSKRTTRRERAADGENVAPAATKVRSIKRPRKRKNAETEAIAEADDEPQEKNDAEMIVDSKKSRERAKKTAKTAVKQEKSKKNSKAELALSEEAEIEEQDDQTTEMKQSKQKNLKKGSVKKTISKGKRNAKMVEKNNDARAEEAIIHEVRENGEAGIEQIMESKRKKKSTKNTNIAVNGKTETKKKQKKGQLVPIIEEENIKDVTAIKEETIAATNLVLESLDKDDAKDASSDKSNNVSYEENNEAERTIEAEDVEIRNEMKNSNDFERSATFLSFE